MSDEMHVCRGVDAEGEARTDYDAVSFTVTISKQGRNGPEAKQEARPIVQAVQEAIERLKADGVEIPTDERRRLTFEVVPNQVYRNHEHVTDGYLANYLVSFRTPTVAKTSEIMDALTSIVGVSVAAPQFEISDPDSLYEAALTDAFQKALVKFRAECRILGLDPDDFGLASWQVRSSGRSPMEGKMAAMAASACLGDAEPTEIESGQAKYTVTLVLQFAEGEGLDLPALEEQAAEGG